MLYLVGTPIGNLADFSARAKEILSSVDVIACEDTRRTGMLLAAFDIHNKLMSYHEHNRVKQGEQIIRMLHEGKNIALVSDAGMPCISDPIKSIMFTIVAIISNPSFSMMRIIFISCKK